MARMGVRPASVDFTPLIAELRERPNQIAGVLGGEGLVLCSGSRALLGAWLNLTLSPPGLRVLAAVTSAAEALEQVERQQPGLLLCTDRLEAGAGVELVEAVKRAHPTTRTLLLVGEERRRQLLRRAIAARCDGICLESRVGQGTLLAAVQALMAGGQYIDRAAVALLQGPADGGDRVGEPPLSRRELEVLDHLQLGLSNDEIGGRLFVSPATVKTHVRSLMQKLGARDRGHAAVLGLQRGLIDWREPGDHR